MPSRCRVTCCRRAACTRFWPSTAGSCFRMRCSLTYSPRRWGGPACRLTWSRRCWCSKRWKSACGLPVATAGFHSTVLTYWRRPLAASARPNRIFDAVREVVAATGALTGKTRRALDSTVLEDAVATQDTVIQLIAAIRRVRREVPGAAEVVLAHCTAATLRPRHSGWRCSQQWRRRLLGRTPAVRRGICRVGRGLQSSDAGGRTTGAGCDRLGLGGTVLPRRSSRPATPTPPRALRGSGRAGRHPEEYTDAPAQPVGLPVSPHPACRQDRGGSRRGRRPG